VQARSLLVPCCLTLTVDQHRNIGVGNESHSFAADEHAGHTAFAMRCHDDSIAAFMLSHIEYGLAGIAMADALP
jgi:hypothetical protein